MSDGCKKFEDELQLRLLTITEDPTSQGCQYQNKRMVFRVTFKADIEERCEIEKSWTGAIH